MTEEITPMERLLLRHRGWPTQPNDDMVVFIRAREELAAQCADQPKDSRFSAVIAFACEQNIL